MPFKSIAAFDKVHKAMDSHWKDPINVVLELTDEDQAEIYQAIIDQTATVPKFMDLGPGRIPFTHVYRIKATGYRMGPAGDH